MGYPAVLYVAVDDQCNAQVKAGDGGRPLTEQLENLAKSVTDTIEKAYPPIYRHIVHLHFPDGSGCLAVVIPGSETRPHFAGASYVRQGPETKLASSAQFDALIAERDSVVYRLRQSLGESVMVTRYRKNYSGPQGNYIASLTDCNQHFATLKPENRPTEAIPLRWVELSFDYGTNRLMINCHEP